ncbi:protein archease isoform X3 [Mustela lutreola]|uniref:Protein archease n=1 Tax=Mustela putorius furo TaxID=9669 RepID=A0A8U0R9I0_MUSPF|nr:protein archease isoform X3 [Mustela erminea]XP_044920067.1 protein archease isoform X4 [Mustela putorius furo]XP_058994109.1 protein archease isoform X3 [Mustela lutreola]
MKGGSRVSSVAIMAQEEEDIRDYNLTEEQKAIKAKYPPVIRKYEYLDHTADVQWGEEFSLSKHPQGTEVKAITYSAMQVYDEEKPEVFVIIDI